MKKIAHISSSNSLKNSDVRYEIESEKNTFVVEHQEVSSTEPYPITTMKLSRNAAKGNQYSAQYSINITLMKRQETNYLTNQRLAGKLTETISTKNG